MQHTQEILSRFVVLEGVDGAGTTTQLSLLTLALESRGIPVWKTAEPTLHPLGQMARKVLRSEVKIAPEAEAALFAADRWDHLYGEDGILAQHRKGTWVLCDRYLFSSLAYQGLICDEGIVQELNARFPLPAQLVYLDVPEETASFRRSQRDINEKYEYTEFQIRVAERYRRIVEQYSELGVRVLRLDGQEDPKQIHQRLWEFLFPSDT